MSWLLLLAPLALLCFWLVDRTRRRRLAHIAIASRPPRALVFAGALLLALVAVLEPRWGETTRRLEPRGVDLVVCLDVSRSMLARDVAPSRLERAHAEAAALAERAAGDRLGLVLFAGEARLAVPLTRDRATFAALAARADPLSVERGGSDLGAALRAARRALEGRTGEHAAILVVTDGEDLEERGLRAARECAEAGIAVHCVGLGSPRGAKIPFEEGFLRDRAGNEVVSRMDPERLARIAEATGGIFAASLVEAYEERVLPVARRSFEEREHRERRNRYQWPLFAAVLLWLFDLSGRRA